MIVAQWIVNLAVAYAALGFVFAVAFIIFGVGKIDPAAKGSTAGFRLLILFGSAALWPLMLNRWLSGQSHLQVEKNDHRNRAREVRQ